MKAIFPRTCTAIMGLVLCNLPMASAVPTLTISSGDKTITVYDQLARDLSSKEGVVQWSGSIGVWQLSIEKGGIAGMGITKPELGAADDPMMLLGFTAVSSAKGSDLVLTWYEDGFVGAGMAEANIFGGSSGSVSYETMYNDKQLTFEKYSKLLVDSTSATVGDSDYSLKQVITIHHNGWGVTMGMATLGVDVVHEADMLTILDGGMTAMFLGLTFLGMGGFHRRFKSTKT